MPMPAEKKKAWTQVIGGLVLMATGVLGWAFGRNIKQRAVRLPLLALSFVSIGVGFYLFVSGTTDLSLGIIGQAALSSAEVRSIVEGKAPIPTKTSTMTFPGPNFFEKSVLLGVSVDPALKGVRRLKYRCADRSEDFTIYLTRLGVFGIPKEDVTCDNGEKLLVYDPSNGFVMEIPQKS